MPHRCVYAMAAAWVLTPAPASADSVTISINTTVLPVCRFSASSNLDPGGAGAGSATVALTGSITYRCTSGVAPAFTITAGCAACANALGVVPVTLSDNGGVGRGMGSGRELTLVVRGPGPQAPIQTASVGFDLGKVSVTVAP